MKHPPPQVTDLSIVKGHAGALQVKTKLVVTNPSNVDMNLGTITFTMAYQGKDIGNVTIRQLDLIHGSSSTFESDGYIYATLDGRTLGDMDQSSMVKFIGDYISGTVILIVQRTVIDFFFLPLLICRGVHRASDYRAERLYNVSSFGTTLATTSLCHPGPCV